MPCRVIPILWVKSACAIQIKAELGLVSTKQGVVAKLIINLLFSSPNYYS